MGDNVGAYKHTVENPQGEDLHGKKNLERNIGYVLSLVHEKPGELNHLQLIRQTRLKHNEEEPLGLIAAINAITAAKDRELIEGIEGKYFPKQPQNSSLVH